MADHRDPERDRARRASPELERARIAFAAARADDHAVRERYMLELAVRTSSDDFAHRLEFYAHQAHLDAVAIAEEHGLED